MTILIVAVTSSSCIVRDSRTAVEIATGSRSRHSEKSELWHLTAFFYISQFDSISGVFCVGVEFFALPVRLRSSRLRLYRFCSKFLRCLKWFFFNCFTFRKINVLQVSACDGIKYTTCAGSQEAAPRTLLIY